MRRRELAESGALFTVLDAASSAIIVVDEAGLIGYVNPQAVRAFGYDPPELVGGPVEVLMSDVAAVGHARLRQGYVDHPQARAMGTGFELEARRKDGTMFPVEISLTPLPTPYGLWVLAGVVDITPRRRAEDRVRALSRAHLALAELNAAILRSRTVEELFLDACQVVAGPEQSYGAWIGRSDDRSGAPRVELVASAGPVGPITGSDLGVLTALPRLAAVVAQGEAWFCADVPAETTGDWADWAREQHLTAILCLPLGSPGQPGAVLTVHGTAADLDDDELRAVLHTMAANLSFALERLAAQARLARIDAQRVELLRRLVAAQEEERSKIAADVHDDSVQSLAALDLRLGMLRNQIATRAPDLVPAVAVLQGDLRRVSTGLRHLLFNLEPADPSTSLMDQFRDALDHVFEDVTISVSVDLGTDAGAPYDPDLPPDLRGEATRIVKEALNNVRRHADASTVRVVVHPDDAGVEVAVVDDGVGPGGDPATLRSAPGHRGLDGMRDRAQIAGGWCRLERDGGLTTLRFWLPRDQASAVAPMH